MCALSGMNWNNSSNAGVWAVNLNNARNNSNNNVGFRADSIPMLPDGPKLGRTGIQGDAFLRVASVTAKSWGFRSSSRARSGLDRRTS